MKQGMKRPQTEPPPIAGQADLEYESKIEAARVTAEWRAPRRPAAPQRDIETLPLFGDRQQLGLFGGDR
jgi:hypothetical protein